MSPLDDDPRAYRATDADGKPVTAGVGDGSVWLQVGGEVARLDKVQAIKLGARVSGAGYRFLGSRPVSGGSE